MVACPRLKFAIAIVATFVVGEVAHPAPAERADGYRGIWYMNQPTGDEYAYKYSGGLGTYPQQHVPIAIHSAAANKTFFCYGGSTGKPRELACMISYFDHATGMVPRPRIVVVKHTDDAHENPAMQIDEAGHVWLFCSTHGPAKNSYIFRSRESNSIDEFEQIAHTNFSYSQPWVVPGRGFLFLHTRYTNGRRLLHWMTSGKIPPLPLGEGRGEGESPVSNAPSPDPLPKGDGFKTWSAPAPLAQVAQGHYQISGRHGDRVATAFNYHPLKGGLNARTNLYYLETADMGATWRTASGNTVSTPLTEPHNPALIYDYSVLDQLVYLKDINFDAAGRPVILYLTSEGYAPGPASGTREWFTTRWTGDTWVRRPVLRSDHNYDYGCLHIEGKVRRIVAPSEPGPQSHSAGGEMVMWVSNDEGDHWSVEKQLTRNSQFNHTYARRPLNAHSQFYAFWADGNPLEPSESRLYFTDRAGSHVWRLPARMGGDFAKPDVVW